MKTIKTLALASLMVAVVCPASPALPLLKPVVDVPLPGGTTRFDYMSLDAEAARLYFSHMGDGALVVFDTKAENVVTNLPGFPVMTGVIVVPSLKKVYGSVTKNHEIAVVDTEKLSIIKRIPDGEFPDGLAFSPETHKIFVSDEAGEAETVINTQTDEKVNSIEMGGEVGNTQYDPTSHLIYACVQTRNQLVAINPKTERIVARYDLKGGKHPHGFYIDDQRDKAYIACQDNAKLIVFNLKTHRQEEVFPIGESPDVLAFDRSLNRLYVACESGVVSIFKVREGKLMKEGDLKVGPNCHTVAVDSKTHKVYFPLKNLDGAPVLRIMIP